MTIESGKPLLLVIGGPTASGKTAFSIELAKELHAPILNADSRQFYRELCIGTAKPSLEELDAAVHFFIGSHSIFNELNASTYAREAELLLHELFQHYPVVILTGGSGLYIEALTNGLDSFPPIQSGIREKLSAIYASKGIEPLQELLQQHDPPYYQTADLANARRLIRALEVCLSSGQPYSSFRKKISRKKDFQILKFFLSPKRDWLYQQINARVDHMLSRGLVEEANLWTEYAHLSPLKTHGYAELFDFFAGKTSLERAVELIKQHTRNYAKRQLTWFRRDADFEFIDTSQTNPSPIERVLDRVRLL